MWILDSGASKHVCHGLSLFQNTCKVERYSLTLPNKITLPVKLIGSIKVDPIITLTEMLYVPNFDMNLISIGALNRTQRFIVYFTCNHALIRDIKLMRMIGRAKVDEGLYVMGKTDMKNDKLQPFNSKINVVSLDVWHKRLGHPSNKCLSFIKIETTSFQFFQSYKI